MVPEKWSTTDRIFCHFGLFLSLYLPMDPENQIFEKMKKKPGDIITLDMCTIPEKHMYGF